LLDKKKPAKSAIHLETWQWVIICLAILAIGACTLYVFVFSNAINSAPIITASATGSHLFNPSHGGYSLDYSTSWSYSPVNGMMLIASGGDDVDSIFLTNEQNYLYLAIGNSQLPVSSFLSKNCSELLTAPNLTAQWVDWGTSHGCLIFTPGHGKYLENYYFAGRCSDNLDYTVSSGNVSNMKDILSTLRCGPDAIK